MFDNFFGDFVRPVSKNNYPYLLMGTDVRENSDNYELDIELPGCKKEDVKAELKDGYLTVSGKKEVKEESENAKYLRHEIKETCERSFYVGDTVKSEDVKAKYENGILELFVPKEKPEVPATKYITVE